MTRLVKSIFLMMGLAFFCSTGVFAAEEITITSYYPSPYGSYSSLQTDKLGVGDNNGDTLFTSADTPVTSGDVWIAGKVGIGITPQVALTIRNGGGIIAEGVVGSGPVPVSYGTSTRLLWYPRMAAFRAGAYNAGEWEGANIGLYSAATGFSTLASGSYSTAMGYSTIASGSNATALGQRTTASGQDSFAAGGMTVASGFRSIALGESSTASNSNSIAIGHTVTATAADSISLGTSSTAGGNQSLALGNFLTIDPAASGAMVLGKGVDNGTRLVNSTSNSLMVGFNSNLPSLVVSPGSGAGSIGNVGIGGSPIVSAASDVLQIGNFWSFHNGGDKALAFNAYYGAGVWRYRQTLGAGAAAWYYGSAGWPFRLSVATGGVAGGAITWIPVIAADVTGNVAFGTDFFGMGAGKVTIISDYNAAFPAVDNGGQLVILGKTNMDREMQVGIDTTDNYGFIRAGGFFGPYPIALAPDGGGVGIGTSAPGAYKLYINGTGYLNAAAWAYASDRRLKENISPIQFGLPAIEKLNPVRFDYIKGDKKQAGFIGQEVEKVLPDIIIKGEDGMLGLRTELIIPYLVKAIQEQQAMIKAQQFEINGLKIRLGKLERK